MIRTGGAARLLADARAQTGLEDFGDPAFLEPLERLVDGVQGEGRLNRADEAAFRADVTRLLRSRLAIQHAISTHPQIRTEHVADPIVITGLARTGTTKLHRVLATDPGLQKVLLWQALFPAPLPAAGSTVPDPRIALAEEQVAIMTGRMPEMLAAHPWQAQAPEEEALLLQLSFRTLNIGWVCRTPSFVQWVVQQDLTPAYADLRQALQYLQWQDGGRRGRPWVLKAPRHLGALEHVLAAFPKATVVHCHRDLKEVVPSIARFAEVMLRAYGSRELTPEYAGQIALWSASGWQHNLAARREVDSGRIVDIGYRAIRDDIASVAARIYDRHGLVLDEAGRERMNAWERDHPQYANGRHVYSLDRYGLTHDQVDKAFAGYLARFPAPSGV